MPTVTRLLPRVALAFALTVTLPSGHVRGGGLPDTLPPEDWVTVKPSGSDILQFLQTLPHADAPARSKSARRGFGALADQVVSGAVLRHPLFEP